MAAHGVRHVGLLQAPHLLLAQRQFLGGQRVLRALLLSSYAQAPRDRRAHHGGMATTPLRPHTTTAFYVQAVASFAVSLAAVGIGIAYLPVSPWVRAFLTVGVLYTVTSAFTLAKCVRDRQEETAVVSRVDQARLDKLLAEQDLLRVDIP